MVKTMAELQGVKRVALSGGVMQNKLLVELIIKELSTISAQAFLHRRIPTNDQRDRRRPAFMRYGW
jgi:hydrogenase maturation factor HypF (carbamoyltransferase family)